MFRPPFSPLSCALLAVLLGAGCGARSPGSGAAPAGVPEGAAASGVRFRNVAGELGLRYRWPTQPRPVRSLESFGRGCAFLDWDGDGWQDILLVGEPAPVLFRNRGGTRFEQADGSARIPAPAADWKGCAVGDYDGDGYPDLLLTGYRRLALFRNERGRAWTDVTRRAGLDPGNRGHWGSSAGFMDLDGDGPLDLVLLNYVVFGPQVRQYCELVPGERSGCPPSEYRPEFGEIWRGSAGGRFTPVPPESGMASTSGKALVIAFADVDGDGRPDFYIGNDGTPAELMLNRGGMRFENIGLSSGAAYGAVPGNAIAAMGADWADYDGDGRLDLAVSAFSDEPYSLLRALGPGLFEHSADVTGLSGPTFKPLGFGTHWLEFDNDGWPDLFFANGHVYDNARAIDPLSSFRQPMMFFHSEGGRRFVDLAPRLGGEAAAPILGRGSARGDFDNDGRIDLLVVDYEGAPLLLQNRSPGAGHWITLDLRGRRPNTLAYGSRVTARAGSREWVGQVSPACSYLSSSDPRVHFGLGSVARLDSLTIRWPSGVRTELAGVAANRVLRIREPGPP